MHVSHLAKACQLLGYGAEWRSAAVHGAVKGLANAMDMRPKFDNYTNWEFPRRVLTAETLATDFGMFAYQSFISLLRGPSEALPARRAPLEMRLDTKAIQADKALLWVRKLTGGSLRLILELGKRKDPRGSVPLMRPCFCGAEHFVSDGHCPVRDCAPLVSAVTPSEFIDDRYRGRI